MLLEETIDFTKYFLLNDSRCFGFSFLQHSQSCLQLSFIFLPLKKQFSLSSYKPVHCAFDYNYIQTSSLTQANVFCSFLPGELQFTEEQRSRNGDKMKKAVHLVCVHDKGRVRWELPLLPTCGRASRVSQSVWRQLENSPEPGLIESLSSSLCASWVLGISSERATQRAALVLRRGRKELVMFKVVQICHVLTAHTVWGGGCMVWDLSAGDCVYEILVRAWKCFECAELIEYSVYQGCVCAS